MSDEVVFRCELSILKGNLNYRSNPNDFRADMVAVVPKGPCPGAFTVPTTGIDVDLSELTVPGPCRIYNLDDTNKVHYGIADGTGFHPLGEVGPGEGYVIRLSSRLGNEYGSGTYLIDATEKLHFQAENASCNVLVEAFEA
jgi:hypothetical protein